MLQVVVRYRVFLRRSSFGSGILLLVIYFQTYLTSPNIDFQVVASNQVATSSPRGIRQLCKYNITRTPNARRWLIHSVHVLHPLKDLLIAVSLFSVYNISLAEDLISASMLTAACFKLGTSESRAMTNFLLPKIKTMVEEKKLTNTGELYIDEQTGEVTGMVNEENRKVCEVKKSSCASYFSSSHLPATIFYADHSNFVTLTSHVLPYNRSDNQSSVKIMSASY